MMNKYLVKPSQTVKEVVGYMEANAVKAVLIVEDNRTLLGMFTLGDMRHYFLHGGQLSANITEAMNRTPIIFSSRMEAEKEIKVRRLVIYPIVENGKVIDVVTDSLEQSKGKMSNALEHIPVVIMAGGKGTRLYPYTKILPKALIPIGEETISERIIKSFQLFGCHSFYMILNHKANMIKSYFGDVKKEYQISFEEETEFMGTGGGLSRLKGKINSPFFLSNCDILISADLECLYRTHIEEKNKITFVCAMKDITIPYGVIAADEDGKIIEITEKPAFSFLTNTGLYLLEPEVIAELNDKEFVHMPDIAKRYIERGEKVGVFPISEKSWMDMGQFEEMESMMNQLGV